MGENESLISFDLFDQPRLILTHSEKVVLLRDLNDRTKAIRTFAIHEVLFGPESLVRDAVPALIIVLIDLSSIVEILENLLNDPFMAEFCRTDEVVIGDIQPLPEGLETFHHFIAVSLWIHSPLLSSSLHLLTMFVCTRQEEDPTSFQSLVAGEYISGDRGVGMADMGNVVDVVDRSSDVEFFFRFQRHGP
jgi:hypothetical protein